MVKPTLRWLSIAMTLNDEQSRGCYVKAQLRSLSSVGIVSRLRPDIDKCEVCQLKSL